MLASERAAAEKRGIMLLNSLSALGVLTTVLISAQLSVADLPKTDSSMIQTSGLDGTWQGAELWIFEESSKHLKVGLPDGLETAAYRFYHHGKRAARLEVTVSAGHRKGQKWRFIYNIDGNILRIGYIEQAEEWPHGFDDKGIKIITLKRVQTVK